ncbi:ferrous iron transporter B [uncultured Sphingosinicella sp.]|uniref:ferrous iron transporter B n=1 Tax=uncultured Sphingosinicella sp. TaxID=478748 RepID=UPI0030DB2141|tara:strand:+ start:27318 stop:29171 length:1854 start_codon:yes stop_codon:yes gene_type:complete
MSAAIAAPMVALVGNPNAGKTSLFNALTGARQKVGNYPGVTVERKVGAMQLPDGAHVEIVDLPGTYSLSPHSPDEQVTRDVLMGEHGIERAPDAIICVVDATNLRNHLRFVLELARLGRPMVVALNMIDLADRDGTKIDTARLSQLLGLPVVPTVAVRRRGLADLGQETATMLMREAVPAGPGADIRALQHEAQRIADAVTTLSGGAGAATRRIDNIALHPVFGPVILAALLFIMFQAVFAWAEAPMAWIEDGIAALQTIAAGVIPEGWVQSMIVDGVLAGVGGVVVFLPQILILFAFILVLEQSGYMTRAAFLMDRLMAYVGLNGRAFIPLLSSFACAIPGIMATRSIDDPKDRLTTILIAPLMTCSARLPVYAVMIAAFIPDRQVGFANLQGLVLLGLYVFGIVGAMVAALVLRRTVARGAASGFMMEMPKYQWPVLRDLIIGLWQRGLVFMKRAGGIILASTVLLWAFASYPVPPEGSDESAIEYSIAGRIGSALEVVFAPIGFNHEISMTMLPTLAAREVSVAALGTIYSLQADDEEALQTSLVERLRTAWPLPTALAFLAWVVFAPQCISTLAVVKRETNGWKWPLFMFAYLFALAYVMAGLTYWISRALIG